MYSILEKIQNPADLKKLAIDELIALCGEIRCFLIETISKTGGHIGANLGVIELTVALHYVFDAPKDKIIFDTGHQGYTQKLLTGRLELFKTLNQTGGLSRFLCREESEYDIIDASHAGTAISIASGMALNNKIKQKKELVVVIVGDGALVEGMSAEGLNFTVADKLSMIVVINDNGMAIPPNVGGIKNLFSGDDWHEKSRAYFEGLGHQYIAVPDGHNIGDLIISFKQASDMSQNGCVMVHVKTEKGKGLAIAKNHKYKMHFSMPFNPATGEGSSPVPAGKTYATVAADQLRKLMRQDKDIIVITPSTPYASGLDNCLADFSERTIDVGMAEQHAIGMACGLALSGAKPFVCYQSTFMQRAFDQIIHDICFMNLPVTILAARSGFAGLDSHTHHGIYDISYLRCVPNLKMFYPGHSFDLEYILEKRATNPQGPMIIFYPYENIPASENEYRPNNLDINDLQEICPGDVGYILAVGNRLETAIELKKMLAIHNLNFGIINIRWLKPIPENSLRNIFQKTKYVITMEENVIDAGFGSIISEMICDNNYPCKLIRIAIPDAFVKPGPKTYLSFYTKIDAESSLNKIRSIWQELF
ncbi:1-deoxy-D-xylulose-5-phosphate synthase [Candidatus Falkowbacteria bacterium]|nr:1-deoxy-D-xylulose-5-phosphate synthase [Candidatus Falkowbacteria bacterium]